MTTLLVHRSDAEGALTIDSMTGLVTTPLDYRPDWSDGLLCAQVAEWREWYQARLSPAAHAAHTSPDRPIEWSDLEWIALNEDGNEVHLEADPETRMGIIATWIGGIVREPKQSADANAISGATTVNLPLDQPVGQLEFVAYEADIEAAKERLTGT